MVETFGPFKSMKVKDDHIIVTCNNQRQKSRIKQATDIDGITVSITDPTDTEKFNAESRIKITEQLSKSHPQPLSERVEPDRLNQGIIFGVPPMIDDTEILDETGAIKLRKLTTFKHGIVETTDNMVLTFLTELPSTVHIGFLRFRVKEYIPRPYRCTNCQRFGHKSSMCYRQTCCPRCAGNHTFNDCTKKDDENNARCTNCRGEHSAAWIGCPKYQEIQRTLTVSVKEKMSYKDALTKVKKEQKEEADQAQHAPRQTLHRQTMHQPIQQTESAQPETAKLQQQIPTTSYNQGPSTSQKPEITSSNRPGPNASQQTDNQTNRKQSESRADDGQIKAMVSKITDLEIKMAEILTINNKLMEILKMCMIGLMVSFEKRKEEGEETESVTNFRSSLVELARTSGVVDLSSGYSITATQPDNPYKF